MEVNEAIDLVNKFNNLQIEVQDVTENLDRETSKKVIVTYQYQSQSFKTSELSYKRVTLDDRVLDPESLEKYFGAPVLWLDIDKHGWPQGSGDSDLEEIVITDMCGGNDAFREFLMKLVNNKQTGWIQQFTKDGQRGQYYHNLVNNNHWHDIILMIKAYIGSKGEPIDENYFSPLVFQWKDGKRTSLSRQFGNRKMIDLLQENIKAAFKIMDSMKERQEVLKLLNTKKQIILQGPPGTGKTRLAKEIASDLCKTNDFSKVTVDDLKKILFAGLEAKTPKDKIGFTVVEVSNSVKIKISTGNTYTITLNAILDALLGKGNVEGEMEGSYLPALVEYVQNYFYKVNEQVQLIQFHPSYSYEDFVRGIRSNVNDGQIEYVNENRILAVFAKRALDNFKESTKDVEVISKEKWASAMMQEFADSILEELEINPKYQIGDSAAYIFEVEDDAFRYKGDNWLRHQQGLRMKFRLLVDAYLRGANSRKDFKSFYSSGLVNQHATYFSKVLSDFKVFLKTKPDFKPSPEKPKLLNFVLIIDEINRANLSSVLGELIYALEYRNEPVSSMYAVDEDYTITLPPNLFIIGTMNTADRSVGHIDYAIRRRFAFYPLLPDASVVSEKGSQKANQRFKEVQELFVKDNKGTKSDFLSPDFDPNDVMLGHSYFLESEDEKFDLRMQYEIKPILKEYVKDGILTESALTVINKW